MKRFHINISVSDLSKSITFYSSLFGTDPSVKKDDYAKWMLDDPRVNFSISMQSTNPGIDHVGIQAENEDEFNEIRKRLNEADAKIFEQENTTCCYAESSKAWLIDPNGIAWETFITHGESVTYNDMSEECDLRVANMKDKNSACCAPS